MAEEMIVKHCQKNFLKFSDEKKKEQTEQAKKKEREEQRKREMDEKGRQEADKIAAEKAAKKAAEEEAKRKEDEAKASAVVEKKPELAESEKKEGDKKEEDTGPAPVGNGGTTDKYNWTQTLEELHVYIPVESDVKGKTLKVTIDTNHLYVIFIKIFYTLLFSRLVLLVKILSLMVISLRKFMLMVVYGL